MRASLGLRAIGQDDVPLLAEVALGNASEGMRPRERNRPIHRIRRQARQAADMIRDRVPASRDEVLRLAQLKKSWNPRRLEREKISISRR